MREPLSDDDVKRIAAETTRQLIRRVAQLILMLVASWLALMILPAALLYTMRVSAPAGTATNVVSTVISAVLLLASVVVVFGLARGWRAFLRS